MTERHFHGDENAVFSGGGMLSVFVCALCLLLLLLPGVSGAKGVESLLEARWRQECRDIRAVAGFALLDEGGREAGLHADSPFPLLSVFKLHVAMNVLEKLSREGGLLTQPVHMPAEQLLPDRYSPMRDAGKGRSMTLPLREVLRYMIAESDNNACDILIARFGGLERVRATARALGGEPLELRKNEAGMRDNIYNQYANWSTPRAVVRLLRGFFESPHIEEPYKACLADCMRATTTGGGRLAAGLPPEARIGHKTGSSDRSPGGLRFASNDVGFFRLPDGRRVYMAAFVMQSLEKDADTDALAAAAARAAYELLR